MSKRASSYRTIEGWFVLVSLIAAASAVSLSPVAAGIEWVVDAAAAGRARVAKAHRAKESSETAKAQIESNIKSGGLAERYANERLYPTVFLYEYFYGDEDEAKVWMQKAADANCKYRLSEFQYAMGDNGPDDREFREALQLYDQIKSTTKPK